jgi:serine/threonine protein kinase
MGEVYRARDTRLDRIVAIKILPPGVADDPEARQRFEREARTISHINHPHICTLHDVGRQDGIDYLVFEHLEGETLARRIARGPLPLAHAVQIAIDICDALDTAHSLTITHRDLKSANVMLIKSGPARAGPPLAKLLDFGIAKVRVAVAGPSAVVAGRVTPDSAALTVAGPLTMQGMILGTVQYMAPELLQGRDADARSDIWAFGCVLYEMLAGVAPFGGNAQAVLMAGILEREPRPLPDLLPSIPSRLWDVTRVCLEKDPDRRWQSARDLLRELRWIARDVSEADSKPAATSPRPTAGIGRRQVLIAGAAVVVSGAGAALWTSRSSPVPPGPTGPPVIVLMDSPHPERVYDPATRKTGGTNADDLTDLLRDLPVLLLKETTNATWDREYQVLQENPALIVAHRSSFYDTTLFDAAAYGDVGHTEQFAALAHDKFDSFMGYIGQGNPQTHFIVYSRGSWPDEAARARWVTTMGERFPMLRGRVEAMRVPLDRATFRHPVTGGEIRALIEAQLKQLAAR